MQFRKIAVTADAESHGGIKLIAGRPLSKFETGHRPIHFLAIMLRFSRQPKEDGSTLLRFWLTCDIQIMPFPGSLSRKMIIIAGEKIFLEVFPYPTSRRSDNHILIVRKDN